MSKRRDEEAYEDCYSRNEIDTQAMEDSMNHWKDQICKLLKSKDEEIKQLKIQLNHEQMDHKNDEYVHKDLLEKNASLTREIFELKQQLKQETHAKERAEGESFGHMTQHSEAVHGQEELVKIGITLCDKFSKLCDDLAKNSQCAADIAKVKRYRLFQSLKDQSASYTSLYGMEFGKFFANEFMRLQDGNKKYEKIKSKHPCFELCYKYHKK